MTANRRLRNRGLSLIAVLLTLALTLPLAWGAGHGADEGSERLLVTFPGAASSSAVSKAGGTLVAALASGVAVVDAPDDFERRLARLAPGAVVERDSIVRALDAQDQGATWEGATWEGATWEGATWEGATWEGATWEGATWEGATWEGATWEGATWEGATWEGATWEGATWEGATWEGATWESLENPDPGLPAQWGLTAIRAHGGWTYENAANAPTVCIVDSGVDPAHPDLASRLVRDADGNSGYDFVNNRAGAVDDAGHGTHVAGIVAAVRGDGFGVAGVSSAQLLPAKILDASGAGLTSDLVRAIDWCVQADVRVILLALKEDAPTRALDAALANAAREGVLLVAAAGNTGPCNNCVVFPASHRDVLAVGAIAPDGAVASFSATGHGLDVVAPGARILSTMPGGSWAFGSGTSQAAAFAAGVAALAWSAYPDADAGEVARAICTGARDGADGPGSSRSTGWGLVDAPGTLFPARGPGGCGNAGSG